jgi:hypothetical protein
LSLPGRDFHRTLPGRLRKPGDSAEFWGVVA